MASSTSHVVASSATTISSTLAFIFALVAITSKEWVLRNEYPSRDPRQWTQVEYTLYRSPFRICTATAGNVSCQSFHPFGNNTSCESIAHTGNLDAVNSGDARLCQQIQLSGHFAIASTTLISLAFLLSLALLVSAITRTPSTTVSGDASRPMEGQASDREQSTRHKLSNEGVAEPDTGSASKSAHGSQGWSTYGSFLMLLCLSIGIITALLSQFYAVLGLIQSAPNNADFASSHAISDSTLRHEDSWYQGRALSTYETCAWGFAAVAAVVASRTWRTPEWF